MVHFLFFHFKPTHYLSLIAVVFWRFQKYVYQGRQHSPGLAARIWQWGIYAPRLSPCSFRDRLLFPLRRLIFFLQPFSPRIFCHFLILSLCSSCPPLAGILGVKILCFRLFICFLPVTPATSPLKGDKINQKILKPVLEL